MMKCTHFFIMQNELCWKNMDIRHYDVDEMHVFGTNRTKVHYFTCKLLQYNSHSRVSLWHDIMCYNMLYIFLLLTQLITFILKKIANILLYYITLRLYLHGNFFFPWVNKLQSKYTSTTTLSIVAVINHKALS